MSNCSRFRWRRFTILDFKIRAFSCIYGHFQQYFAAHVQKQLFMNFWWKLRHDRSIPRPRFPYRVRNFVDLWTFSIGFCIYFYFHFVWPTDLESMPHALTPTEIISSKFEVDMTIHCRVVLFLLMIRYVTLWPLDLKQLSYVAGHVTNPATKLEDLGLFFLELRVLTSFIRHHWKCIRGHCACPESHDSWVGGQKQLHFSNHWPL